LDEAKQGTDPVKRCAGFEDVVVHFIILFTQEKWFVSEIVITKCEESNCQSEQMFLFCLAL